LALGKTLGELGCMPHAELVEWAEYAALEPFGSHYEDLRAGTVAAAVCNVARDVEKAPQPFSPLDFVPWNAESQRQDEPRQFASDDAEADYLDRMLFGGL
jgi:hypothetical protein